MTTLRLRSRPTVTALRDALSVGNMPMTATLLVVDVIVLLALLGAASVLVWGMSAFAYAAVIALTAPLAFGLSGLYSRVRSKPDVVGELRATMTATGGSALVWMIVGTLVAPGYIDRGEGLVAAAAIVLGAPLAVIARRGVRNAMEYKNPERILIIGAGRTGQGIARQILADRFGGSQLAGFVDDDPMSLEGGLEGVPVLPEDDLIHAINETGATRVVLAYTRRSAEDVLGQIRACSSGEIRLAVVPRLYEMTPTHATLSEIGGVPVVDLSSANLSRAARRAKRAMDLVVASAALMAFGPLMALIAIAIKLDSKGPVFFRQERAGYRGETFRIFKFRSMSVDAESRRLEMADMNEMEKSGPLFKMKQDPRTTRVGRFLRKTSLDELPQLINVVNGTMSLVGPRPFVTHEAEQIEGWAARRLDLMPGITGLWQIAGRNDVPFEEMVRMDYTYVANWSPWWDLRILIQTVPSVLKGTGAS